MVTVSSYNPIESRLLVAHSHKPTYAHNVRAHRIPISNDDQTLKQAKRKRNNQTVATVTGVENCVLQ